MNIRSVIFISFLSFGAIIAASQSRPLADDLFGIEKYDQADVADWQKARDQWGRNVRMLQCAGIAKSLRDADSGKMRYSVAQYGSHLCTQFSATELREITLDCLKQQHANSMSQLQEKCNAKQTEGQRTECHHWLSQVFALFPHDKDTLIHELTHGGTKIAQTMAAKK